MTTISIIEMIGGIMIIGITVIISQTIAKHPFMSLGIAMILSVTLLYFLTNWRGAYIQSEDVK